MPPKKAEIPSIDDVLAQSASATNSPPAPEQKPKVNIKTKSTKAKEMAAALQDSTTVKNILDRLDIIEKEQLEITAELDREVKPPAVDNQTEDRLLKIEKQLPSLHRKSRISCVIGERLCPEEFTVALRDIESETERFRKEANITFAQAIKVQALFGENLALAISKEMATLYRMTNVNLKSKRNVYSDAELAVMKINGQGDDKILLEEFKWLSQILFEIKGENPVTSLVALSIKDGLAALAQSAYVMIMKDLRAWLLDPESLSPQKLTKIATNLRKDLAVLFGKKSQGVLRLDEFLKVATNKAHDISKQQAMELIRQFFPMMDEMSPRTYVALGFETIDKNIEAGLQNWEAAKRKELKLRIHSLNM
ncbi:Oidioi.mRNA.OKI2018_I69.YSR.g17105.t1.cds [Oikopleura dioica]|uniref:Oidioi.mRNA.OKI2018_I69.YSR.g17105.t1.cds n=1 Tax=Oikopleura dioica TaxID=34765 RepID=A0ABN7SLY5_OIKDI|nr:Oidioi.mRNA.OKI2018_I69.YSR.g17105.t1.cds [Oikopleura dioica]